ncbi:MAG: J domain-containing protein [Desulfobulbaceae bacterium]|nr:J domain-containing protein [Desulfobulbaceae bacterium]
MNRDDWHKIKAAAALLQLGETATLGEIKRAYHRLSKQYHPDVACDQAAENGKQMYRLTAAYELLKRYCENYRFPLIQTDDVGGYDLYDPQEWWRARFGQDPIWADKKTRRR